MSGVLLWQGEVWFQRPSGSVYHEHVRLVRFPETDGRGERSLVAEVRSKDELGGERWNQTDAEDRVQVLQAAVRDLADRRGVAP